MASNLPKNEIVLRLGLGSRERLGRCNSAPVTPQAKARWVSRAEPTGQVRDRHLRSQPLWVPPSLQSQAGSRPSTEPVQDDGNSRLFFAKPPFVFAEPQPAALFQLKQSLLLDEGVTEASPPIMGSTFSERERLGSVEEDQAPPSVRPEMPVRLKREDMAPKSRARYPAAFFQAARHDGLHRARTAPQADLKLPAGALTYYSVETCSEWRMPRRGEYKSPKSRRPLEGLGGRVKPGVCRQLLQPPANAFGDSGRAMGDHAFAHSPKTLAPTTPATSEVFQGHL